MNPTREVEPDKFDSEGSDPIAHEDDDNKEAEILYEEVGVRALLCVQSFQVSIEVINKFLGKINNQ